MARYGNWNCPLLVQTIAPCSWSRKSYFSSAKAAVAHPMFLSFVLPEVVRSVATRVVVEEADIIDEGSWLSPWVRFFFSSINSRELDDNADNERKNGLTSASRRFVVVDKWPPDRYRFARDNRRVDMIGYVGRLDRGGS